MTSGSCIFRTLKIHHFISRPFLSRPKHKGGGMCNRVPLHTVFVLLYSVYIYIVLSVFFRVWTSFNFLHMFYMLLFWTSLKDMMRECKREVRGNTNSVSQIPSQKNEMKTGTSSCGSFVVPYFQPATSIDCLHLELGRGCN